MHSDLYQWQSLKGEGALARPVWIIAGYNSVAYLVSATSVVEYWSTE